MIFPMEFNNEIYKEIDDSAVPNIEPNRYLLSSYGHLIDKKRNTYCSISQDKYGYLHVMVRLIDGSKKIYAIA